MSLGRSNVDSMLLLLLLLSFHAVPCSFLGHRCMLADPEGREILRARPVINEATVDLAALAVSVSQRFVCFSWCARQPRS